MNTDLKSLIAAGLVFGIAITLYCSVIFIYRIFFTKDYDDYPVKKKQ